MGTLGQTIVWPVIMTKIYNMPEHNHYMIDNYNGSRHTLDIKIHTNKYII